MDEVEIQVVCLQLLQGQVYCSLALLSALVLWPQLGGEEYILPDCQSCTEGDKDIPGEPQPWQDLRQGGGDGGVVSVDGRSVHSPVATLQGCCQGALGKVRLSQLGLGTVVTLRAEPRSRKVPSCTLGPQASKLGVTSMM